MIGSRGTSCPRLHHICRSFVPEMLPVEQQCNDCRLGVIVMKCDHIGLHPDGYRRPLL
ncbi:hypothetical protein AM571_PA00129 (plasmid) [Rhizobium etli 8C-3]|uniref:Uncharacterized protein n=1 Tax=Rhizobium etli 8C-3 TaxID=538025 RepID=A0A1L5PA40_RHIET|nr:hypothetical protein AM571_PA00129 [Rhizobium etli 8C-3]